MIFTPNPDTGQGEALAAFHAALASVQGVAKTETADMGKYEVRYASLNAVAAECSRACAQHGLALTQEPSVHEGLFAVFTTLLHSDLSRVEFAPMCLPLPKDAQALGSATTYLKRYSLVSYFRLQVEDDDGRAATVSEQTQPGRRTEAERMIRELIAGMDDAVRHQFIAAFRAQFGMALADLPANRHGDALTWSRAWKPPPDEQADQADAAWTRAARGEEGDPNDVQHG